jgi:hypothetical protein
MRRVAIAALWAGAALLSAPLLIPSLEGTETSQRRAPGSLAPVDFAPSLVWKAPQFIQADRKGNVFLLRGDTLQVYPVRNGQIAEPVRLDTNEVQGGELSGAALGIDGSTWVLAYGNQILCYQDGRQKNIPEVPWFVSGVALQRNAPVVGVLPMSIGRSIDAKHPEVPPLLLKFDNSDWDTYIEGRFPKRANGIDPFNSLFAEHSVRLIEDVKGRLWLSYPYAGRLARLTPGGRLDCEIVFGEGEPQFLEDDARLQARYQERLRAEGRLGRGTVGLFTAKLGIRGFTVHRDGTLYMVLGSSLTGGRTVLARYNSAASAVEAVPLKLESYTGELTMAAGNDALYMAAADGSDGRWRLTWEQFNQVRWDVLERALIKSASSRGVPGSP